MDQNPFQSPAKATEVPPRPKPAGIWKFVWSGVFAMGLLLILGSICVYLWAVGDKFSLSRATFVTGIIAGEFGFLLGLLLTPIGFIGICWVIDRKRAS